MPAIITQQVSENPLREKFAKILGGFNFITPVIVDYVQRGRYICEISKEQYPAEHLVGVTIVDTVNKERCMDKDTSFTGKTWDESMQKAYSYIESL